MTGLQPLFQTVSCPLCEGSRYTVVRPPRYPEGFTAAEVKKAYSASSDHELLDQVVACSDCGMQFVNPRPNTDVVIESYAEAEDPTFVAQNPGRIETFGRMLRKAFPTRPTGAGGARPRSLDIGCAGGAFLVAARDFGFDPVGVEPSRWMASFARRTYNVDVRDGILGSGMFPEKSFDVISIWDVIEHVPDPHSVFMLIRSLLKPGGTLLLSYPDVGTWPAKLLGTKWPFWLSVHLHYYTRATMTKQLGRAGFRVESIHPLLATLQLSYVFRRAGHYMPPFNALAGLTNALGVGKLRCTYYIGQTWLTARATD